MASVEENKQIIKHDNKTLFVRNLSYTTTSGELEKVFSDIGPLKSCFVVGDKDTGKCRGFGYVKFTLLEDAQKALKTVKKVGGRNVQMMFAKRKELKKKFGAPKVDPGGKEGEKAKDEEASATDKTEDSVSQKKVEKKKNKSTPAVVPKKGEKQAVNPYNEGKRARLIVRNLSFKCSEKQLEDFFSKYGQIVEVNIPKKGGKKLGCGFVQFNTKAEAGQAVREVNGKSLLDRKVAVDFTLPREMFEKKAAEERSKAAAQKDDESEEEEMEVEEQSDEEDKEDEDDDKEDDSEDEEMEGIETKKVKANADSDGDEEEEDDDSGGDDDEESDDDDEESDSGIEHGPPPKKSRQESDVSEGRTVFIRNMPFHINEEELEEHFSSFGDIKYARIVYDKENGMSRGMAFIQFNNKSSANSCIAGSGSPHELGGRELTVTLAVSREQAGQLVGKKDEPKEQKDSRNLYLVREGMIRPGTDQAKDVPQADLVRRQKIDAQKRKKLKDQDVFVSSTRLCVHNIPTAITDKKLREIVFKAAGDKKAKLIECKIMRDLNRVNTEGVAKSKGFAFCAFSQHEHALQVLREMNNNADTFEPNKRPIVEFSLESRKALEIKQKRFEKTKFKQKQAAAQKGKQPEPVKKKNKKKKNSKQDINSKPLEMRKEQDKVARSLHQGSIGLPSHSGPKKRHKARNTEDNKKMKKTPNFIKKAQEPRQKESQKIPKELKQKSRRQKPDTDNFDKMVASYKKKIMSGGKFS